MKPAWIWLVRFGSKTNLIVLAVLGQVCSQKIAGQLTALFIYGKIEVGGTCERTDDQPTHEFIGSILYT